MLNLKYGWCWLFLLLCAAPLLAAPTESEKPTLLPKPTTKPDVLTLTPEREAVGLAFVKANHAELAELLIQLKTAKPQEYESGVLELFRTSERLQQIQSSNPARYPLELEAWKVKIRLQLLAAEGSMAADDQLRSKLRDTLDQQAEIRLKLLKLDRDQLVERVRKADAQIEQAEKDRVSVVDRQLDTMLKSIDRMRTPIAKPTDKP